MDVKIILDEFPQTQKEKLNVVSYSDPSLHMRRVVLNLSHVSRKENVKGEMGHLKGNF